MLLRVNKRIMHRAGFVRPCRQMAAVGFHKVFLRRIEDIRNTILELRFAG